MPEPEIRLDDCWAKTDPTSGRPALTVREHCLIVGTVAEQLSKTFPEVLARVFPAGSLSLAAAHDIGKLTFGFQAKCDVWKEWARGRGVQVNRLLASCRNHAAVSQMDFANRLGSCSKWSLALGGHHGRFLGHSTENERTGSTRLFAPLRDQLAAELIGRFGNPPDTPPPGGSTRAEFPHVAALCGFIILCDWLGSDEENFPLPSGFPPTEPTDQSRLTRLAGAAIRRRSLDQPGIKPALDFGALFTPADRPHYSPNPLQQACRDHITGPGLHIVEAPMGMGKTEAALFAASGLISAGKASGLYFALPTQLTSNKIHERVASFLAQAIEPGENATLALAHAASWLKNPLDLRIRPSTPAGRDEDDNDPRVARCWFTSRRALLARYGVGTIDQALMGALPVRFAALRLFGLAGKVVVFDEVHSYDAYTARLLDRLIEHLLALRCTVIILSATLTLARRAQLIATACPKPLSLPADYPLLTCCQPGNPPNVVVVPSPDDHPTHQVIIRRIELCEPELPESLIDDLLARARAGSCILVIRNTVALAQQTYSCLQQEGVEIGLLHSRFPFHVRNGHPVATHRDPDYPEGRESVWAARLGKDGPRPSGCILVATQVAEQSLDIDADLLVTDLCPADMLLQRIGRLWRHMSLRPALSRPCPAPETWVLTPNLPPEADADAMDSALKPHSAVYAPYVLLRTLGALPDRLKLPTDIRPLLEVVHAPADGATEPSGWTELRIRMEERVRQLEDRGGFLVADPYLPPVSDGEFDAPTRYSDFPTIDMVLLSAPPALLPGGGIELSFHSGESLIWSSGQPWNFAIARAVFLSTVRVPRYQTPKVNAPDWLTLHSHGPVLAAFVRDGVIATMESETPLPFRYEHARGLVYEKELASAPANGWNDADQPDDECFF